MKPYAMTVQNFKAISGPHTVRLDDRGIVHVLGRNLVSEASDSNGSSKTALMISAPCWCFTGRTEEKRRVVAGNAVMNRFTDGPTVVEVVFEEDGVYTLRRERSRSGHESVKLVGPHGRVWDAKHEIERLVGIDWQFFTNVIAFGPDASARFTHAPDAERKEVFDRIIPDLERLNRVFDRADLLAKEFLRRLDEMGQDERGIEVRLEELGNSASSELLEQMSFERWLSNMAQQQSLRAAKLDLYEKAISALTRCERMDELRPKVDAFADLVKALRAAEIKIAGQRAVVERLAHKTEDNVREAQALLAQGRCPTCAQKFGAKTAKDILGRAKLKDGVAKKQLNDEGDALETLVAGHEKLLGDAASLEVLAKEYDLLERSGDSLQMIREDLDGVERRLEELEAGERPRLKGQGTRSQDLQAQLDGVRREIEEGKALSEVAQFWTAGLRVKIKTKLLDGVEEYLDSRLRRYSAALTAGEVTIGFTSRTKLKKGTHQDKVAVTAEHLFGAAELDLHSSGERQRIDLAIILALQDLARQQHGSAVRLSLFDEVFDHLDETGVERLMGLLAEEKSARGTIAVVTQSPRIAAHPADHLIVVERSKEGTKVYQDEEEV